MSLQAARERVLEIAESLDGLGTVTVPRFFGGAGFRLDGVQVGFVIEGTFYLRVDAATRAEFESRGAQPFRYAGARGMVTVGAYFEVPEEVLEDPDLLRAWILRARQGAKKR